ncbi:hypothetical protein [Crossiella sp. NPDC003009]
MSLRQRYTEFELRRAAKYSRMLPRWRTQSRRRLLVALWLVFPVALIAILLTIPRETGLFLPLWLTVYGGWLAVWRVLRVLTSAITETMSTTLDERQRQLRDQAVLAGYSLGLLTLLPLIAYLLIRNGDPDLGRTAGVLLAVDLALLAAAPTVLLAWALPDDDPEDFQDQ